MQCPKCQKSELATKQTNAAVSLGGVVGALLFLAGLVVMLVNVPVGLLVIIVGLLVGMAGRRKITTLVCPACHYSVRI